MSVLRALIKVGGEYEVKKPFLELPNKRKYKTGLYASSTALLGSPAFIYVRGEYEAKKSH